MYIPRKFGSRTKLYVVYDLARTFETRNHYVDIDLLNEKCLIFGWIQSLCVLCVCANSAMLYSLYDDPYNFCRYFEVIPVAQGIAQHLMSMLLCMLEALMLKIIYAFVRLEGMTSIARLCG